MKHIIKSGAMSTGVLSFTYNVNPESKGKGLSGNGYHLQHQSIVKPSELCGQCLSGCLAEIPEGYL